MIEITLHSLLAMLHHFSSTLSPCIGINTLYLPSPYSLILNLCINDRKGERDQELRPFSFFVPLFPQLLPLLVKPNCLVSPFLLHPTAFWVLPYLYPQTIKTQTLMHLCLGFFLSKGTVEVSPLLLCFFESKDRACFSLFLWVIFKMHHCEIYEP